MRFRNKMAYDLIRGIPQMMGLRTQFVHLWVCDQTEKSNDTFEDYGLFTPVSYTHLDVYKRQLSVYRLRGAQRPLLGAAV